MPPSEEGRSRGAQLLQVWDQVHPDWTVADGNCPVCRERRKGRKPPPYCEAHRWANKRWLIGGEMVTLVALRDNKLMDYLKGEGLWP